jgi:hypothetical protein
LTEKPVGVITRASERIDLLAANFRPLETTRRLPMTEEARKAIDLICKGDPIECSAEIYHSEIRDALVRFALVCVDNNDTVRMRIALAEVNKLDRKHGLGAVG